MLWIPIQDRYCQFLLIFYSTICTCDIQLLSNDMAKWITCAIPLTYVTGMGKNKKNTLIVTKERINSKIYQDMLAYCKSIGKYIIS